MQKMTAFPFTSKMTFDESGWPQLDRGVTSEVLRKVLKNYYTNGVFGIADPTCLKVTAAPDGSATVLVSPGTCLIEGATGYIEDTTSLELPAGDSSFPRIDTIVARLNDNTDFRAIYLDIIIGTPASSPTVPALTRSDSIWEIGLANLYRPANSVVITNSSITDTRLDSDRCGYVTAIDRLDTAILMQQLNAFYAEFVLKSDASYEDFLAWAEEKKTEISTWQKNEEDDLEDWEEEFKNKWDSWLLGETKGWQEEIIDWFDNLKEKLSENAAVQLQLQIGELNKLETEESEDLVTAINSLCLSYDETMAILAGVKTVTVKLSASDGASVEGQSVTLHNVMTGEDVVMEYSGDGINFKAYGDMEYSLSVSEMEYHVTPDPVNILITEGEGLEIDLEYNLKPLNDLPWSKIIDISESGKASEVFNIHDEKEIELTTGEKVVVEIVGFDHDVLTADTEQTAGITFGMKDCLTTNYRMNPTNTNVGGWKESEVRTATVREHLYDVLPEELKAGIKNVNKSTSAGNKSSTIETTADDVWLFSLIEMGVTGLSTPYSQEGTAYPAFTSNAERVKHGGHGGATRNYHTRSPYVSNATQFRYINTSGGNSYVNASTAYGMAVGFCV